MRFITTFFLLRAAITSFAFAEESVAMQRSVALDECRCLVRSISCAFLASWMNRKEAIV